MPLRSAFLAILAMFPAALLAWSPSSDQRIARKAAELAPPDMRLLISQFPGDYQRGLAAAARDEGSRRHIYDPHSPAGSLREQLRGEMATAVGMVRKRQPMSQFVEKLGVIAHLTADLNNPFNVPQADDRLRSMKSDFETYADSRTGVIPTVFYGLTMPLDPDVFMDRTAARTEGYYPLLAGDYFRGGVQHTSADFDDRSTAFGIVALTYSHAVSDVVNVYYYIWQQAGGDVRSAAQMRRGTLLLNESAIFSPTPRPVNPQ